MENIFLEKSYTKCRIENSPSLFFKKSKLGISIDRQLEIMQLKFIACPS